VIDDALLLANDAQVTAYVTSDYRGVAYNRHTDTAWFVDANNQQVHIYNTAPLTIKEKRDLFRTQGSRVYINPSGKALTYPLVNREIDTTKNLGAAVIKDDFLYVVDGTSMYAFNIFDERLGLVDTYTVPANITDLSVDLDGNILASIGSGLTTLELYHDYYIVDNEQGIVYYREEYGYVDVTGAADA
jgi:hypothetical protein